MRHRCPTCERSFDEPGFCPYDRTTLVVVAGVPVGPDQQTLLSAAISAQPDPSSPRTDVEPRRTFPMSPSRPQPPPGSPASQVRALSASDNPAQALASYGQTKQESEYDRLVGQTLDGRYFVEQKIGEGGMGVVFSVRHAVIERPLAIKVLKREVMRDTATIRRFVQEAKAASRIGHPNIVDVTDFGTTPDGMTYSVMEFVDGPTLGGALRSEPPFPLARIIRIAVQIARALGAAHDKGIVHRDLKPENVFLVARDGRPDFVKIVDFGIAKVAPVAGADPNEPRLTRAGSVFGTPEYMAPEQAAGRSDTDGRVDIYALGVILYQMITGRVPHRGDSMVRTLAMQMLDPVEPPSRVRPDLNLSPEVESLVLKALAKKRENRFQTMGELLAGLEKLQQPIGVSVTGSPVFAGEVRGEHVPAGYALAALPPGADPGITPAPGMAPGSAAQRAAPESTTLDPPPRIIIPLTERGARAKSPTHQRQRHEPEFVTRDKPPTFDHLYTSPPTSELATARRRWPLVVLGALIVGGATGAIALVVTSRSSVVAVAARDAAEPLPVSQDGMVVAEADAGELRDPADAADIVMLEPDASVRIAVRSRDAGRTVVPLLPPQLPTTPNGRGTISIQVITKPEGATLYEGQSYRGPGGTHVELPLGARTDLTCRLTGYKPGTVHLVFDGKTEYAMCVLERIKICINNIKNPFDDCQLDPNAPMP